MDNYTEYPPPKKIRTSKNMDDIQLKEYVPWQMPSTLKQMDSIMNWKFKNQETFSRLSTPKLNPESQIMGISSVDYQVSNNSHLNKLQKLRILSPKGRDLGEFNVELQNNNPLKGKTLKIVKSPIKKVPIILSNKELSPLFEYSTPSISQINLTPNIDSTSCYKTVYGINKKNIVIPQQQHFVVLSKNETFMSRCTAEIDKEKQQGNSDIIYNEVDKASTSETNFKNSMYYTNNDKQNYSEINNINNYLKIQEVTAKNNESSTVEKIPIYTEVNKSQFPLVNYKKYIKNSSDKQYRHFKTGRRECIAIIKKTKDGKIITSLMNAYKIDKNLNKDNFDNNDKKSFNNEKVSGDKNILFQIRAELGSTNNQVHESKTQKNVMTIIPDNKKCFNQNAVLSQECDATVSSASTKHMTVSDNKNAQSKDDSRKRIENIYLNVTIDNYTCNSEIQQIADVNNTSVHSNVTNKQDKTYQKDSHKDLLNQCNIIQRAIDSVEDNELCELALKALTDCKIGIQRYSPTHSLKKHKSVCDTQVQTEVFGLLDPKSFILINNKDVDINRINQINLQDIIDSQNLSANLCFYTDSVSKVSDACEQQNIFDVDNFLKHFEKSSDVIRIKDTLSATMKKYRNLMDHLQKDFESVKHYDQNGMLNIHNAVISNNIYLVQRQLMILKYCKENIDILTVDGLTSLELAIKYDIHSEIVKLLLEAGAQPVIPKYIYESALIIASKQSSPLLSMLIKYIPDVKLLDLIDSNGLAALHYCSMHGNVEGVNALITAGANIDMKDGKSGRTPFFHAMDNNHTLVAQALLKAGAIANIANYAGQTALPIMTETRSSPFRISMHSHIQLL